MRFRSFGRAGWLVSEIGFGAWQLGGTWGAIDDNASVRTMHHAFDRGVNIVDTSALYGLGRSEHVVGQALREWRGTRIYVATKAPPLTQPHPDDHAAPMRGQYPPEHLRRHVEQSLRNLGIERIDLFQLHHWIERGLVELDWLETLNELRLEGKIDQIGVSLRDIRPAPGVPLARLGLVASQQVGFNIFEQKALDVLFPTALATRTAILVRTPLASGALSGTWTEATYSTWTSDDKRHQMYRGDRFSETLHRVRAIEALTKKFYPTLAEAALRFTLRPSAVSTVLIGMRDPAEFDLNLSVCDGAVFPEELAAALRPHAWAHEFYD